MCRVQVGVMADYLDTASVKQLHFIDPVKAGTPASLSLSLSLHLSPSLSLSLPPSLSLSKSAGYTSDHSKDDSL